MSLIQDDPIYSSSIVLLTSKDPENESFGTGFVILKDLSATYILTCAHVVSKVGGREQVKIDTYSATVIAQSPDGHAHDLAVLKVETPLDNSILPLGIFGKSGWSFIIYGCRLYDKHSKQYKLEKINGSLVKSVKLKSRYQAKFIDAWQLRVYDQSTLQPGLSGSPVIDNRSLTVIGVVSHSEGQGHSGQAVPLVYLREIWTEMPSAFLREKPYDLVAVRELIKVVFLNENQFSLFIAKNFPQILSKDLPFLIQVNYLINYCHQSNEADKLLNYIERLSPRQYKKFIAQINQYSKHSSYDNKKIFNICEYFPCLKIFRIRHEKAFAPVTSQCEIELIFEDMSQFSPEVREAAIGALAGVLNISREEIKAKEARKGSVKLIIELPSTSLDRLIELYETDRVLMNNVGIVYVIETLEERYYLDKIREFLNRGFTREELVTICSENFRPVFEQIISNDSQSEIIDKLIEYTHRELQIQNLLDLAREKKVDIYEQFRPYIKIPRRPGRVRQFTQPIRGLNHSRLTRQEILIALLLGTGVAALGFLALVIGIITTIFFNIILFKISGISIISSLVSIFLLLGFILIGNLVAIVVSRVTGRRGGGVVSLISITSYIIGVTLFPVILPLLIIIITYTYLLFTDFKHAINFLPFVINIVQLMLEAAGVFVHISLISTSTLIGLAGGGVTSYQRAR
ncbi:MAG: trypsin-like peptidase domain-containing protein [Nostoc sp. NMS7]|uniref:S1 family peptidase n=1 Tax=Nostoc sp. NMS7 TaxID=2815391 RepID=UPI0025D7906E|nr:serine protease [Nostoc sp. NMS7]MBN3949054.1 trypsin-like peptidase domain-containing protein [Nostoc sp. NMS7]